MTNEELMRRACRLSEESVRKGGGPFGAVIARHGVFVAEASNSVTLDNDPTAHAEVNAIRTACQRLRTFKLDDCAISKIYYSNNRKDAAAIGFSDDFIYEEIMRDRQDRCKPIVELLPEEGKRAFEMWSSDKGKTRY